jgi:glycosyltransferase involved in cell wall biosynthesis
VADGPPRIGIDATPLASGHAVRGIGRYVGGLIEALSASSPEWAASNVGVLTSSTASGLPLVRWRTVRSPWRPQDLDPMLAPIADRLAIRRSPPRAWHHTDPTVPASPLADSRTVVTVYDLIPLRDARVLARIRPHRRWAYRRYLDLVRRARGVIAISATTADDIEGLLGVPRDRIAIVTPLVTDLGGANDSSATPATRQLLFVGVPEPHKRPELTVATLAELVRRGHDARLVFVGPHPPDARRHIAEAAEAGGVAGRIDHPEPVDDDRLGRLYAASTLLATSSVEGFGLPPVEAILAGGRVAATPIAAYRESVAGIACFAASDDPAALADAVELTWRVTPTDEQRASLRERFGSRGVAADLRAAYRQFELA